MRANCCREDIIDGVLVLRDLGAGMSITNDAESVVRWACASITGWNKALPIVYRDTEGVYDSLEHSGGEFTGFLLLGAASAREAADKILGRERC